MSVATAIIDYGKELMEHKDLMNGKSKEEDYYIGKILYELGYRILGVETEAMIRKYEIEYESGQSDQA